MKRRANNVYNRFEIPKGELVIEAGRVFAGFVEDEAELTDSTAEEIFKMDPPLEEDKLSLMQNIWDGYDDYVDEYRLYSYKCSDDCGLIPANFLNSFVETITVSAINSDEFGPEIKVYFTDTIGRKMEIPQHDIFTFLLKKPKITVSAEGLLLFYTNKEVLVTLDCNHYAWVRVNTEKAQISRILSDGELASIIKTDGTAMKVKFTIDALQHSLISYEVADNSVV